jgi:hypothetical protein
MAPSRNDKGKRPREEDPNLKEEHEAGKSRGKKLYFCRINECRTFLFS